MKIHPSLEKVITLVEAVILQDIKKDSADIHKKDKSAKQKIFNKKTIGKNNSKLNSSNKKKSTIKSIFEVLN